MDDPLLWQLLLQVILILLNAVFACAEIAVISMKDAKIAVLIEQGNKRAKRLEALKKVPARFLSTIQVAITLAGFLGSAFAAENFADRLTDLIISTGVGIPAATVNAVSVVLITLILSYFTLVLGELVPKQLAMKKTEPIALALAGVLTFCAKIFTPIVWLLTVSTNAVLRLMGIDPNAKEENVSEEEVLMMVDEGTKSGVFDSSENEIIQNVFEFGDLTVDEFLTHRTEVSLLWTEENNDEWDTTINASRHTLFPICGDSVDDVVGILNAKDYFRLQDKSRESVMKNAVTAPYFVPENVKAGVLFKQMKKTRNHFAVVLDDYGGFVGIVTMNDILEQLVGDLEDDATQPVEEAEIKAIDSNTWEIKGTVPLDEVAETLKVDLPVDEYDTFGGFVFSVYGSVPDDGTQIEVDAYGLHVKVILIEEHRVEKAIVTVEEPRTEEETEEE